MQFGSSGLILYWSRVRKNVTQPKRTYTAKENINTEKAIIEANLIPWVTELSGPIPKWFVLKFSPQK